MSVRRRRRLALTAASLVAAASLALGTASATASTPLVFWAWGHNSNGQLGTGAITADATTPQAVSAPAGATFTSLTAGSYHACGLTTEGAAYCWGYNLYGQVGNSTPANYPSPVAVSGGLTFAALTAGRFHSCGLTPVGAAYCWGDDADGQLGNGTPLTASPTPVPVSGGLTFTTLSAGGQHSCGLTSAGAAYCWGDDAAGQLGNGTPLTASPIPVPVSGGLTFRALAAGNSHTCALTAAGAAYCWGYNILGQLGDGTTTDSSIPMSVAGGRTFTAVTAGDAHSCGLTAAGATYCWGNNGAGMLGDGTTTDSSIPVPVAGGRTFTAVTAGGYHTCGLTAAGTAYCWGANGSGQLGDGTTTAASTPEPVAGGLTLAAVVSGAVSLSTYGLPLRPASGDDVPRAALQQFARTQAGTCEAQPDDLADFPALTAVRHQQWAPSWAQWPNSGTGGYVCTRQPYYTSIGTWAVQ